MRLIPSVAAVLAIAVHATAQPRVPPLPLAPGTSSISGTLRDATTNAPVANCTIRAGSARRFGTATSGTDGTYAFTDIAEGQYYLTVECASYLRGCVQPSDSLPMVCSEFTLFRDQRRSDVDFRLTPGARARGRVVGSRGQPIANATVRLGRPINPELFVPTQPVVTTTDGTFELVNLPGGDWRIEVDIPPAAGSPRMPVIHYPGVLSQDDAGFVKLTSGGMTENVTITVPPIFESTLTVRMPPPDATMRSVSVVMIRASPLMTLPLQLDAEGRTTVRGLNEGRYFVTATALAGQEKWVAYEVIDFVQDSIDVSLHLQPGGGLRGRIVAERGGVPPLADATIGATWVDEDLKLNPLSPDEATVAADGTFEIAGLFGRRRLELLRFDPDWKIQSVLYGRSDVTSGIDVTPNATTEVTIVVGRR